LGCSRSIEFAATNRCNYLYASKSTIKNVMLFHSSLYTQFENYYSHHYSSALWLSSGSL
jgi:hypothetical protein